MCGTGGFGGFDRYSWAEDSETKAHRNSGLVSWAHLHPLSHTTFALHCYWASQCYPNTVRAAYKPYRVEAVTHCWTHIYGLLCCHLWPSPTSSSPKLSVSNLRRVLLLNLKVHLGEGESKPFRVRGQHLCGAGGSPPRNLSLPLCPNTLGESQVSTCPRPFLPDRMANNWRAIKVETQ